MRKNLLPLILLLVVLLLFVSCKTLSSVADNVKVGMTKQQVIDKCGTPASIGVAEGKEYFIYDSLYYSAGFTSAYMDFVISFDANGKVDAYGQHGTSYKVSAIPILFPFYVR